MIYEAQKISRSSKANNNHKHTATGFPWLLSYTEKAVMRMIVLC